MQDSSVYDLAAKWVDRNCRKEMRHQFLRAVEQALKANTNIDTAAVRTRAIERRLRDVQELPASDAPNVLLLEQVDGEGNSEGENP